jgi:hypothetical protein
MGGRGGASAGGGGGVATDGGGDAACANECAQGAQLCADASSIKSCGNYDADSCLEWSAPAPCPMGQMCVGNQCVATKTCKRGVGYNFDSGSAADMGALSKSVSWFYNWQPQPSAAAAAAYAQAGMEFVPMVWNGTFNVDTLVKNIPADAKYLLGFNEPNFTSQGNLTPQQAAQLWPQLEDVATRRNLKLVSPSPNYCSGGCNQTDPFVWFDQFFAACTNCRVDYLAIHWYACTKESLEMHVTTAKKYNRPIWVTEFDCADSGAQPVDVQRAYMKAAVTYLEMEPMVFRYAWFSARTTRVANVNLLGATGVLTLLGQDYVAAAPAGACVR